MYQESGEERGSGRGVVVCEVGVVLCERVSERCWGRAVRRGVVVCEVGEVLKERVSERCIRRAVRRGVVGR